MFTEQYISGLTSCAADNADIVGELERSLEQLRESANYLARKTLPGVESVPAKIRQDLIAQALQVCAGAHKAIEEAILSAANSTMELHIAQSANGQSKAKALAPGLQTVAARRTLKARD
jgi:hypothetical protein